MYLHRRRGHNSIALSTVEGRREDDMYLGMVNIFKPSWYFGFPKISVIWGLPVLWFLQTENDYFLPIWLFPFKGTTRQAAMYTYFHDQSLYPSTSISKIKNDSPLCNCSSAKYLSCSMREKKRTSCLWIFYSCFYYHQWIVNWIIMDRKLRIIFHCEMAALLSIWAALWSTMDP